MDFTNLLTDPDHRADHPGIDDPVFCRSLRVKAHLYAINVYKWLSSSSRVRFFICRRFPTPRRTISVMISIPEPVRHNSDQTITVNDGSLSRASTLHEDVKNDEDIPDDQMIKECPLDYPDGGLRAWLVVCGVWVRVLCTCTPLTRHLSSRRCARHSQRDYQSYEEVLLF